MDITVTIRMQQYKGSPTSTKTKTQNKKSPGRTNKVPSGTSPPIGQKTSGAKMGALGKGFVGLAGLGIAKKQIVSGLNTANKIQGTVTGNRFREQRQGDVLNFTSPIKMIRNIASTTLERTFELARETQKLDTQRRRQNQILPFREGNSGEGI